MTKFNQIFAASTNNVSVNVFNWDDESEIVRKPIDPEIEFDFDPLAFALSAAHQTYFKSDVHFLLEQKTDDWDHSHIDQQRTILDQIENFKNLSNDIQKYFRNKLLLRRLKGSHMSDYMTSLEQLLDNPKKIKRSQIKILLKLNDFYKENRETDQLFGNFKSLNGRKPRNHDLDEEFSFVKVIERFSKDTKANRYYFTNKNKNLLLIQADMGTNEDRLMDYLSRQSNVIVRGSCMIHSQPQNEDFLLYMKGDFRYYDPNSKTAS
jgi:hypothetical protein